MLTLNCPVFAPVFNEEHHSYENPKNGSLVPSVTRILRPISALEYMRVDPATLKAAAELGTAVHSCIELLIDDDLDEESLDEAWIPYVDAWKKWRDTYSPVFIQREVRLACDLFAGTVDCVCQINGEYIVIDWKTTNQLMRSVGPQTAAYELLVRTHMGLENMMTRAALQLKPNGEFTFERYTDVDDYEIFEHMYNVLLWWNKTK